MKEKYKILIILLVFFMMLPNKIFVNASAYSIEGSVQNADVGLYMHDIIIKKFRRNGEKVQYRRWNETKGYWVDPQWIDC